MKRKDNVRESREADLVAHTIKTWLSNPASRRLLRYVSKRDKNGKNGLDTALRKYSGENIRLGLKEKVTYGIVKSVIDGGAKSFGVSKKNVKESLKKTIFRRGLINILEGIAFFGVQRPQTCAAPFLIVWDFTHKCNLRCKHCYQDSTSETMKNELNIEESKRIIDEFAKEGVVAIAFSGGEPLIRKDFFELAKYAKDKDFYVSIATNGTLVTKDIAKKLKDVVDYVEISLDGFEKTHDNFRNIPGVWKLACRGIKNCVEIGLDTCVATTVTKWNLKEIPKLIDFVEKDLKANRMIFFNFVPTRRGRDIAKQDITPKEREELLRLLYSNLIDKKCKLDVFSTAPQYAKTARKFSGPVVATHFTNKDATKMLKGRAKVLSEFIGGCGCARLYAALEPNGDLFPCVFLPIKVGNLRKQKLREIWLNSPTLKEMRERDRFGGHCGKCEYKYICGGCRARAYGYFGDYLGPDPGCLNNKRFWDKVNQ